MIVHYLLKKEYTKASSSSPAVRTSSQVKDGELFVHWKQIQTDDRWPKLEKGMTVQFTVTESARANTYYFSKQVV